MNFSDLPYHLVDDIYKYLHQDLLTDMHQEMMKLKETNPQRFNDRSFLLLDNPCENAWSDTNPQSQGHITDQNFLESGHHFGFSAIVRRRLGLRSDPPIPKVNVGPWFTSEGKVDHSRGFEIEA